MVPIPKHRLLPTITGELIDLRTVVFGSRTPTSAGVYVVLVAPRTSQEIVRGFGEVLFVGESNNLDAVIGSGHASHPRLSWLVAAEASEVGYAVIDEAADRARICESLLDLHRPGFQRHRDM